MSNYTNEQSRYINYNGDRHTKLLACAGSGKTRCIIARMNRLIKEGKHNTNSVLMLTFSKFTRDDFINKIESYGADYIDQDCVKTIDSFSKVLVDQDNTIDVSLLSFKFMKYLQDAQLHTEFSYFALTSF